ncbi:unnamed protein product, partial [Pocillopora meandrina]
MQSPGNLEKKLNGPWIEEFSMRLLRKLTLSLRSIYLPIGLITSHLLPTNQILKQWLLMPFQFLGHLAIFMLFLLLVSSQKCYRNPSRGCHRTVGCAMLADSAMVAIGNETAGSGKPCASHKETHVISTSTAGLGASTTPEAHTSD